MKKSIYTLLLVLVGFLSFSALKSDSWYHYTSDPGKYNIDFPAKPQEFSRDLPQTAEGKKTMHGTMYDPKNDKDALNHLYLISYTDLPDGAKPFATDSARDQYFRNAIDASVKAVGGTVTSENVIEMKGIPGRKITADVKGGTAQLVEYRASLKTTFALQVHN